MAQEAEYVMYKGDDIIAIGTAQEIADQLGIKKKTVYGYACQYTDKYRNKGKHKIAVRTN